MVVDHPASVALVIVDGTEIVLVRQHRPGSGDEPTTEVPGGKIAPGETNVEAAERELAEECGLAATEWVELGRFWVAPAYSTEEVVVLAGRAAGRASATPDEDEAIEVVRVPPGAAPTLVDDATSLAALLLWQRANDRVGRSVTNP